VKERRHYPRMDLNAKVSYKVSDSPAGSKKATSQNISAEGFSFFSGEKHNPGDILELELVGHNGERPINIRGSVVWSKKADKEKGYYTGVKVLGINKVDEGRFLTLYCNRLIDRLGKYKAK